MKLKIVLVSTIASIGLHIYLTVQHFGLVLGTTSGDSFCNKISAAFDCNAATASSFSKLIGIPISVWGISANAVLLIFLILYMFGFSQRSIFYAFILSALSAATSVVMAGVSTFVLSTYCLYCVILYILSFVNFSLIASEARSSEDFSVLKHSKDLFAGGLSHTITLASVAPLAFVTNYAFMSSYEANDLSKIVNYEVEKWNVSTTTNEFTDRPTLTKGAHPENSKMIITEFADFRCGHCKHAAAPISAFVKAHNDVTLNFYVFPLDGECNEDIPHKSGLSCYLAKSVYCANQIGPEKGWKLHDIFFEKQQELNSSGSLDSLKEKVGKIFADLNMEKPKIDQCVEDEETQKAILAQAKSGVNAQVKGTPTVYVNGKKLSRGQLIPVLEAVYKKITNQ